MPTAIAEPILTASSAELPRKRWTRREVEALERSGILEGQHLELIEGDLFNKMGKKRPHVHAVRRLRTWLIQVFGAAFVDCEAPMEVSIADQPLSEPEPDLVAFKSTSDPFGPSTPTPSDLALVVEVSDTTLPLDLTVKAQLYARAGITEYWVLDINARRLIVHRDPEAGLYRSVAAYSDLEQVAPLAAPDALFQVGSAFPASPTA